MVFYKTFNSKFGKILILWNFKGKNPKISRIYIDTKNLHSIKKTNAKEHSCNKIDKMTNDLRLYLSSKKTIFDFGILDFSRCPSFQKQVLFVVNQIPKGSVMTYKQLSILIIKPNSSRAIGNALATNPFPIIIPCHRIVRSDKKIGNYQGKTLMKKQLLRMEGISFNKNKINPNYFQVGL